MAISKLLSLLYPPRCLFCSSIVDEGIYMCDNCAKSLPLIKPPICKRCGCEKADCVCTPVHNRYNGCVAPFYYTGPAKRAIKALKFRNSPEIAEKLAGFMAECVKQNYKNIIFDFVTSVPVGRMTYIRRGYNQAEILAKEVAKDIGSIYISGLRKAKLTKHQRELAAFDRLANVYGAFKTRKIDFSGKTILLVDDVRTTGATLNECAATLKKAGAKSVYCLTLALTKKIKKPYKMI
ncbi:MAG: ComF family protein [Bacillota bacterium]|nr:ComF family protein [Bacillota bacterium]